MTWAEVSAIYCNNPEAGVLQRAKRMGVPVRLFGNGQLNDPDFVLSWLLQDAPDLIVLAGFLRKIPEFIVGNFPRRIVNIHPALLPEFGGKGMYGMHVHKAVKESGAQKTGITIHYVNAAYDEGGVCQLVMHPFVIGYRSRIWILDELLRHARARGDVFIGSHAAIAAHAKKNG